jgi:hypothetical protein
VRRDEDLAYKSASHRSKVQSAGVRPFPAIHTRLRRTRDLCRRFARPATSLPASDEQTLLWSTL